MGDARALGWVSLWSLPSVSAANIADGQKNLIAFYIHALYDGNKAMWSYPQISLSQKGLTCKNTGESPRSLPRFHSCSYPHL